jgi:hypothetical protein
MKLKPDNNVKGNFVENASEYLINNIHFLDTDKEDAEYLAEFEFIMKSLKESVDSEIYKALPDISKPLEP